MSPSPPYATLAIVVMAAVFVWLSVSIFLAYHWARTGQLLADESGACALLWPLIMLGRLSRAPWLLVKRIGERRGGWKSDG